MHYKFVPQILLTICFTISFFSSNAQVISTFDSTDEDWRVAGDATSAVPQYMPTGGNPDGYISTTDRATGGTWYWSAPAKFLGNQLSAFGKLLEFDLKQSGLNSQFDGIDISIAGPGGLTIAGDLSENPLTTWTHYEVPLDTAFKWRVTDLTGPLASVDTIKSILSDITSLKIRGEYITGQDRGDLDNVILPGTTLPIYLLSLTATIQSNKTLLQWSTGNEVNTSRFEVEHSIDGRNFEFIGKVNAPTNNSPGKYLFHDNNPTDGNNYYRLKMIDKDGSYRYSPVVKVMRNQYSILEAFPNPTTGEFIISGLRANQVTTIQLLDFKGMLLKEQEVNANSSLINISNQPAGIYIIRVFSNNNFRQLKISKL